MINNINYSDFGRELGVQGKCVRLCLLEQSTLGQKVAALAIVILLASPMIAIVGTSLAFLKSFAWVQLAMNPTLFSKVQVVFMAYALYRLNCFAAKSLYSDFYNEYTVQREERILRNLLTTKFSKTIFEDSKKDFTNLVTKPPIDYTAEAADGGDLVDTHAGQQNLEDPTLPNFNLGFLEEIKPDDLSKPVIAGVFNGNPTICLKENLAGYHYVTTLSRAARGTHTICPFDSNGRIDTKNSYESNWRVIDSRRPNEQMIARQPTFKQIKDYLNRFSL